MKNKKYKIVESDLFKKQKEELPKKVLNELNKTIKKLSENPNDIPNSMNVYGKCSSSELKQWASDIKVNDIDIVLEYLFKKKCLNKRGQILSKQFWEDYIYSS